jgi:hypothetical protein
MKGLIKVNGKAGNLENNIGVECLKSTVTITSDIPFSKRLVFTQHSYKQIGVR